MKHLKNRFRLLLLLMVVPAMAQATTPVGLSTVMSTFLSTTQGWYHAIFTDALGLFGALFGIEIVWLVVTWMIGGKDVHDIFSSFIKKLLSIGFFYTVLLYAGKWVPWIIVGFKNVAITAGGEPVTTVSDIAMTGLRAFIICVEGGPAAAAQNGGAALSDLWNLNFSGAAAAIGDAASAALGAVTGIDLLVGAIVGFILLLSFFYVVLELVAVQLEGMIVLSAGVIMLGFGGLRWTTRFVEGYMQYAVTIGVRLMVITLWASFIEWQINPLIQSTLINGNASMEAYGIVMLLALLAAWLTKKLPSFANSILSGQSTISGGELYNAVKGGVIAAAAVATGGAVLAAAGTGAGIMSTAEAAGLAAGEAGAAGPAGGAGAMGAVGGTGASAGVAAPVTSGTTTTSGVQAPSSATSGTASTGVAAPTRSGTTPGTANPGTPTDAVDHRPSAPNAPTTTTPASVGSAVAAPLPPAGPGAPNAPAPTLDSLKNAHKQTQDAIHGVHDKLMPGSPSSHGVTAPKIDLKHLDD
ncbi:MAG: P-type conjugative transfer protein TrbL [Acidithiobacillus sp.]